MKSYLKSNKWKELQTKKSIIVIIDEFPDPDRSQE